MPYHLGEPVFDFLPRLPALRLGETTRLIVTDRTGIFSPRERKTDCQFGLHSATHNGPFGGHLTAGILANQICHSCRRKNLAKSFFGRTLSWSPTSIFKLLNDWSGSVSRHALRRKLLFKQIKRFCRVRRACTRFLGFIVNRRQSLSDRRLRSVYLSSVPGALPDNGLRRRQVYIGTLDIIRIISPNASN
jgi:hypothetical protein